MAKVVNIGSMNIDYVYQTPHFVRGGETLEASERAVHMGGKGLNQTVAMARAGLAVTHVGNVGPDGVFLIESLGQENVNTDHIRVIENGASGHTFIQVTPEAENAILYYAGTNHALTREQTDTALLSCTPGDALIVQNEVNDVAYAISKAKALGLITVFNPAPFSESIADYPLEALDVLILNETEAQGFLELKNLAFSMDALCKVFPNKVIILTLGAEGVVYALPCHESVHIPAAHVQAVDTTGAGDTFAGFAMKAVLSWFDKANPQEFNALLQEAVLAAALCVTKPGAVASIPTLKAVLAFKEEVIQHG